MRALIAALGAAALVSPAAMADEGMWTFDAFPASKVQAAYGFTPDAGWLERIQKASVRLESGCSASVVSRDGLVLTNHHCITDCAANLSSARNDILAKGFLAAQRSEERVCPGLEASILQSIVDVTDRVRSALKDVPADQIATRRAAVFAEIETAACGEDKTIRCDVETFYRGGRYKLYRYDRYQDVRLVFAPEQQAAFFGGDPDNFNFPRYAYDMALLRLYRNGAPVRATHFLPLDPTGPDEGELVFTSGHPGTTQRLLTIAQLEFQRDHFLPWRIEYLSQIRGSLLTQSTKGEEEARQAADTLFGVENSVKVMKGQRGALVEPSFFAAKIAEEKGLRDALAARADLRARYGDPFADIERLIAVEKALFMPQQMLESRLGGGSVLLVDARALVRAAAERARPEGERLPEFGPSRLPGLERSLLAEAPVHPSLEQVLIEFWLLKTREHLGADHPAVKALFGARSAAEIAAEVAQKSRLGDPAVRKRLWDNPSEVATSDDPAIVLYRRIDAAAREARSAYERQVSGPVSVASEKIAGLRFDVLGDSIYPDANFTLRLSYGAVRGWNDPAFGAVPAFTRIAGLWERATGAFPYNLNESWLGARGRLRDTTAMNFVSTNDIIGGNSGSPVVDRQGRIIGLAFDGNIHSLGGAFGYDGALNRTVSVASPVILEALGTVYGASALTAEITAK